MIGCETTLPRDRLLRQWWVPLLRTPHMLTRNKLVNREFYSHRACTTKHLNTFTLSYHG
jgi:hypothetical protein